MVNTKVCKVNTCTLCVCATSRGNASHTCVRHHCMVVCVCLYLYDCMCMIDVWLYDNVHMMSWWQAQDHTQLLAACHPTWLPLYQFMLVEIPGEVPEGSNVDTLWGPGGFRCRYLLRFRKVPVQTPGQLLEGSCADTCCRFLALVLLPLCSAIACLYVYDCMCMIVWQCAHDCHRDNRAHEVIMKVTRLLELVTAYSPTWLPMYEFTCLMTTVQGLMVAFSSLKSGSSLFLIPQLAAGDVPFWNDAVKKWNKAETSKLLGVAPGLIFKRVCYARRNVFEHQMAPVGSNGSNSSFWACPKNGIRMDT